MKIIIAGSRDICDYEIVKLAIQESQFHITTIISGTAIGIDKLGEKYGIDNNIPIDKHPANWVKYGKRAGYLRNSEMAEVADGLIAIWDGVSKGTNHMINIAKQKKLKVFVKIIQPTSPNNLFYI
jgi:hypothetical protein